MVLGQRTGGAHRARSPRANMPRLCFMAAITLSGVLLAGGPAAAQAGGETPPPVSGRRLSVPESILPADVLARVELLRENVDLLRRYMGKPGSPQAFLRVDSARPFEVYSQALNLQLRANRLAFEQVRVVRTESIPMRDDARPADVFSVVDSALAAVLLVKRDLGIDAVVAEKPQPDGTTPSDVFNSAIAAGSEINLLLEQRTSPSDVFQLVTAAVHTAAALHTAIPDGPSLPIEPDFEPNKMPGDVYLRIRGCFDLISQLSESRGSATLRFEVADENIAQVSPNDVGDLAALVVEELTHIHRQFPEARAPILSYYPGRRFPAHVFQRVGLLELILEDLVEAWGTGAAPEPHKAHDFPAPQGD